MSLAPPEIEQLVLNLVLNARDASPSGARVSVRTRRENHRALLIVADEGIGMPIETKARIFEPFFTTKSEGQGTGLGLAIVQALVSRASGGIDVDSAPGKGTTITLSLPVVGDALTP
ncbi:MAG: ATP-binding protein [Polyangiaceae bacterium]